MGIKGLKGKLEPYKTPVQWNRPSQVNANDEAPTGVVIDGPGFAFWIFHQCCTQRNRSEGALIALPSYPEIGRRVLEWLRDVESVGLHIAHVFFDGALPESKLKIRYERLQRILDQLKTFRLNNPVLATDPWARLHSFSTAGLKSKGQPPAPAFLVTVVLDYLFSSEFAGRVRVVLCEADLMCTSPDYCSENNIILTGDSDFIVHNPKGRIVFFEDINFSRNSQNDIVVMRAAYLQSVDFAKRIGVSDLVRWGYFMARDPRTNVKHAADQAKSVILPAAQEQELTKFRAMYDSSQADPLPTGKFWKENVARVLERMDPRLSETVAPALKLASTGCEPRLFPGPLFEDPKRASSWQPSQDIRHLALSIVGMATECDSTILELGRKGDRFQAIHAQVLDEDQVGTVLRTHEQRIENLVYRIPSCDPVRRWRLLALLHVYHWDSDNSRNLQGKSHVLKNQERALSWFDIHLSAQTEGVLYSYRMLRQAMDFFLACKPNEEYEDAVRLCTILRSLPPLGELAPFPGAAIDIRECGGLLKEAYGDYITGREAWKDPSATSSTKDSISKRDARVSTKKKQALKATPSPVSSNFYAVLENDV